MLACMKIISYLCGIETRERLDNSARLLHSHNQCITYFILGSTVLRDDIIGKSNGNKKNLRYI